MLAAQSSLGLCLDLEEEETTFSHITLCKLCNLPGSPGGAVVNNLPANAGDKRDVGSILGVKKVPWSRKFQCSCLENSMDGGAWWTTVHGVSKN